MRIQSCQYNNNCFSAVSHSTKRRHDAYTLRVSGLQSKLATITKPDGAYGLSRTILAPFHGSHLTSQEQDFNRAMSQVRISVEWTFGKIVTYFSYLDFKKSACVCAFCLSLSFLF